MMKVKQMKSPAISGVFSLSGYKLEGLVCSVFLWAKTFFFFFYSFIDYGLITGTEMPRDKHVARLFMSAFQISF